MLKGHSFISEFIVYSVIILFYSAIFFVVYSPVIQKDFYYKYDYVQLTTEGARDTIIKNNLNEGRILNGFFHAYLAGHIRSSNSTTTARLIGIAGLALFASVIWAILKHFRLRSDHAFLISTLICSLPCLQMYVLWINCIPYSYSAFLSSLSALILFNVIENKRRTYEITGMLIAIILLVTSFTIYQAAAMMYWAIGVIFCLTSVSNDFFNKYRRPLAKYFLIGLISMVIYYIVFIKIAPSVMDISVVRGSFVAIHRIPVKLVKFLIIPLKNALNLWNIYPTFVSYIFAIFVSMIIFSEIIIDSLQAIKDKKQIPANNYYQKYLLILCLIVLSYLPNLMVSENSYSYRTLISLGTALCVLFCFGLFNIVEFFRFIPNFSAESRKTTMTVLLAVLVIVAVFLAHHNAVHWESPVELDRYLWERWRII